MKTLSLAKQLDQLVDGATERGQTQRVLVSADAIEQLAAERGHGPRIVFCDPNTLKAAGQRVTDALKEPTLVVLPPQAGHDDLVCDRDMVAEVGSYLAAHPDAEPIAVGAGTINDIVKKAAAEAQRDYVVVPTAASMNGYTSSIAAILSDGVKRTVPAQQPVGIYAPLDVIAAAPAFLNRAGFGDLLSKPFSNADWILSHVMRGVPYDAAPAALLDEAFNALLDKAPEVSRGGLEGIRLLTETLLISGFSMALAGTSAPASGGEHLVSHYWDMEQHCQHAPLRALHGTQVGIATRLSAMLYERLMELDISAIDPEAAAQRRPDDTWLMEFDRLHPGLTPEVRGEVRSQLRTKQRYGAELREELEGLKRAWPELREQLRGSLISSARITRALRQAGCADRASAIGVGSDHLQRTLMVCRHIRNRYVALDLIDDLGVLETWAADVTRESEQL